MKTSELTGAALDWAVAKCEGHTVFIKHAPVQIMYVPNKKRSWYVYRPSTNWLQGGLVIERAKIRLDTTWNQEDGHWAARIDSVGGWWFGETPLIAAMRCFVASKLGDDIEIPKELAK